MMIQSIYFMISCYVGLVCSTSKKDSSDVVAQASDKSVVDRGFTTVADFNVDEYLEFSRHYHKDVQTRKFDGKVLGYVTPWNSEGYQQSELFRHKFTHLSPVWYQLRSVSGVYQLAGRHDVRQDWLQKVTAPPLNEGDVVPKILPRFVFEIPPSALPSYESSMDNIIDMILKEVSWGSYDGIVLEAWTQWSFIAKQLPGFKNTFMQPFVQRLSNAIHTAPGKPLELVLVVPPAVAPSSGHAFSTDDFQILQAYVDMFSVCSYDYSSVASPGPNSPIDWLNSNMQQLAFATDNPNTLLMGLNFYGIDHVIDHYQHTHHVKYNDFINMLTNYVVLNKWDTASGEHTFSYQESGGKALKHTMYYPTVKSISDRITLAKNLKVGISIWELGQGLESFFDLL